MVNRKYYSKKGELKMALTQSISSPKKKRAVSKRSNKFLSLTQQDFKEMNEVSKRGRGLSKVFTLRNIFGDEN